MTDCHCKSQFPGLVSNVGSLISLIHPTEPLFGVLQRVDLLGSEERWDHVHLKYALAIDDAVIYADDWFGGEVCA